MEDEVTERSWLLIYALCILIYVIGINRAVKELVRRTTYLYQAEMQRAEQKAYEYRKAWDDEHLKGKDNG